MKMTAMFLMFFMVWGLQGVKAQETIEVTQTEKEIVAIELEKEADSGKHDSKTKEMLKKVAGLFKGSKNTQEVEIDTQKEDCADCQKEKKKNFFKKIGRALGKASAWVTTTTAKPFITAAGFVKGAVEKGDRNKDLVALYQFILNHQDEFDNLYLEAGTPEEMVELILLKVEDIMEGKSRIIMKDFLANLGIDKEIPEDMKDFELTKEELAKIDMDKLDPDFINNHPEYKEVKPLIGEMTKEDLKGIVATGYFNKAIDFENYKEAVPTTPELIGTLVSQVIVPNIALGVISNTLAGLYVAPVVAAQIGTGVSVIVCKENESKFETDKELRSFCSYVTNRTAYQLMKGRAKGYVAGKKFHQKVADKIKSIKAKRAEKKRLKEEKKKQSESLIAEPA